MNSKMTTNSQISTNEPQKIKGRKTMKTKTKQTTRTGIESENHRIIESWRVFSGEGVRRNRGQGRSIIGRYKIDRRRLRTV